MRAEKRGIAPAARLWLALVSVLFGCGKDIVHEPLSFAPAPFSDGERAEYDVLAGGAIASGKVTLGADRAEGGWRLSQLSDRPDNAFEAEVWIDERLAPQKTRARADGQAFDADYGADEMRYSGGRGERNAPRAVDALDNAALYQSLRALPFAEGYARSFTFFNSFVQLDEVGTVRVMGSEELEVPAGKFSCWRVELVLAGSTTQYWYAKDAPHWFVKRQASRSGTVLLLRRYRSGAEQPWQGSAEPAPPAGGGAGEVNVEVKTPRLLAALLLQFPLMLLFPVGLGLWLWRRRGGTAKVWFVGAGAFVASQVVHLPLNWALGLMGAPRAAALLPTFWVGVVAGLSAGICEELARYGAMRWLLKDRRSWRDAVCFGAGHGGIEAIIFGGLAALTFINILIAPRAAALGVPPEQQRELLLAAQRYWQDAWYTPALAGLERVLAISLHVALSVLVMRAVTRRQPLYVIGAILLHAAFNFPIVYLSQLGVGPFYALATVYALALFTLTLRLRHASSGEPAAAAPGERTGRRAYPRRGDRRRRRPSE